MVVVGVNMGSTKEGMNLNDGGCCVIVDGKIYAIAEERVSRKKYDGGFNQALPYCLDAAGISYEDIDLVVVSSCCEKPLELPPKITGVEMDKVIVCPSHHLSHAYSSFFTSGFEQALIMVIDNEGNVLDNFNDLPFHKRQMEHMSYYIGERGLVSLLERDEVLPSQIGVGDAYRYFTKYLGFPSYVYAGKTMGLSSYGKKDIFRDTSLFEFKDGHISCNITNNYNACSEELYEYLQTHIKKSFEPPRTPIDDLTQGHADLAMLIQRETERILVEKVKHLIEKTNIRNLCIAGGVGLNSVANGKILRESGIEHIYVVPAAGDSGQCLGNAIYGWNYLLGQGRHFSINNAYLGKEYSNDEYKNAINLFMESHGEYKIQYFADRSIQNKEIAKLLYNGKILARFEGRSEFGPRALGNRSILVDPRDREQKDILNSRVKFRESFRPFAPVVLWEKAKEYFDIEEESPYMLVVSDVKKPKSIPAVTHVDNSARVQTITQEQNPLLYGIIDEFEQLSGVPVLLNTSFNIAGEPIVETPTDALYCFNNTDIDCLAIGPYLIIKNELNKSLEVDAYKLFVTSLGKNLS